jgi:hypothetical protein
MCAIRLILPIVTSLSAGLLFPKPVSAEQPREREISERHAQQEAEARREEMEDARRHLEEAERRYQEMMQEHERRAAAHEEERSHGERVEQLEVRIDELAERLHELRRHEVEVRTRAEELALTGHVKDNNPMQRELIEIHRQIQMTQLELERHHRELDRLRERREIGHMQERLEFISSWREVAFDGEKAVTLATQSLVELHMAREDAEGAARILQDLLERIEWLGARTAVRFALKELYTQLDRPEQAIDQMVQVILENSGEKPRD